MKPLEIDVSHYGTNEEISHNISYSLSLGLTEFGPSPCKHDGTFVIVGSGPSLLNQVESITQERLKGRPICAINGAHDFLVDNGLTPDLFLTTDPRAMPQNFKRKNDKTVYLIASRCHPDTFKELKGKHIVIWHAWMDNEEADFIISRNKIGIGGGTTSGLRAVNVAYVLGYRNVHMYGLDSCLDDKGAKRFCDGPMTDEVKKIDVIVGGKRFLCNMAMAQQASDFQSIYDVMPDVHIEIFGGGLLSAIQEERKKKKLPT